jgi:hypothetical protein
MKASKTVLLGLVGLTLVVGVVFATNLICSIEVSKREVHLIPYGYRGPVVIFVDEPNGQPPRYENGAIVYDIPTSGVLATQAKLPEWVSSKYYYITSDGQRIELKVIRQQSEMPDDSVYVFLRTGGGVVDGPIDTLTGRRSGQRKFTMYYVGRKSDNIDSMFHVEEAMLNGKARELGADYRARLSAMSVDDLVSLWKSIRSGCETGHTRMLFFELNDRLNLVKMKKSDLVKVLGVPDETRQNEVEGHLVYYVGRSCNSLGANSSDNSDYVDVMFRNSDEAIRKIDPHIC